MDNQTAITAEAQTRLLGFKVFCDNCCRIFTPVLCYLLGFRNACTLMR